ncbi:hypothetical protein N8E89_24200 (plasmid) [Phyllobacterium sp. A18/5-2]|uniref:hypothetical protein n=1 Tax=Phyllobacterium sp. A18/5-2 TaxID=2978392 RepID=UPI0021C98BE9|nr:hypothetical protein [Phyllobacterium sp. A18/5-2]UXN66280.1 hypothetical protein N8E89_24200 [Phyllobacterium sp. A18/5-2]
MRIEPIGYIVLLLGALSVVYGARFAIRTFCLSTLFGAAAALQLPSFGGGSIQPGHLMVLFLVATALLRPIETQAALLSIAYPSPGFWFAVYILFSAVSAFFLPRIFAGATLVYSSARDISGTMSTVASPLSPGSSNFTQAVYILGDLACFAVIGGLARLGHSHSIARTLILTAMACLGIALLDVGTFLTGQSHLLDFIRNANYTMHTAETISGFKRIVGSFPEASSYGSAALAFFSFTLLLWLERFPSRLVGLATASIGITIALCTSTTAYIAGLFVLLILVLFSLKRLLGGRATAPYSTFLVVALFIVPCTVVTLMLIPNAWDSVTDLISITFADKLQSQSGEERTAWNTLALISFIETATFGAGLGTVRSSSFIAALLSNVGLVGTALFAVFLYSLLTAGRRHISSSQQDRAIGIAAVFSSIAQIASATISGSSTDLGLLFSITAGLATGCLADPNGVPRHATGSCVSPHALEASPMLTAR